MIHDVATELLRRREIRNSLTAWCRHCGFEPAKHHQLLIQQLQRIARGEIDRLAVFMPPGSAKSTYGSVLFPPWFMAKAPGKSIIAASHTLELAEKWGRRVRGLVAGHGPTLGVSLSPESQAAGRWQLTSEGEYFAAGVGGAIVGFRADGAIIDDPVRSHEDAYSETTREKVWDWYKSELLTRLRPGGWVVLISTRWHEDDLAGRVLQEGGWEVVSLPAEAEPGDLLGRQPGEFLWDDDKNYPYGEQLRGQKRALPPATWAAMYQQNPLVSGGNFFKTEWLKPYTIRPDPRTLRTYVTADFAVTEGAGDYTAICVFGVDPNEDIYLLDVWRKQAAPDESVDRLLDFVRD